MGKAIIISGGQGGEYEVDLVRNIDRITATITKLETMAADVQTEINRILATDDHAEIPLLKIELAAIEKYIDGLKKIPEKIRATVWAADLSIGLSGEVGTMEIPDDPGGGVNIVPNGPKHNQSKYDAKRDGIVHPIMNMGPASAFFSAPSCRASKSTSPCIATGPSQISQTARPLLRWRPPLT